MNLEKFVQQIEYKLKNLNKNINLFTEKEFQIYCADALIDNNMKIFMEYPFSSKGKDECDIVITNKEDCSKVKTWIELKPVWSYPNSNYWSPSKFVGEAPFKHDINKLFQVSKNSNAWFVMILFSNDKTIANEFSNPKYRVRLTSNQIVGIISKWAKKEPQIINSFQTSKNYCHIVGWDVRNFENIKYILKNSICQCE